jgi:hypothetical protein
MAKQKAKKNHYAQHAKHAQHAKQASIVSGMTHELPTKDNVKNTLLETGKDLLIGVIGGGLVGAAIGKPSLLIGLGLTGAGHYTENHLATLFGIGLMASNGFQKSKTVEGLDGMDMQSIKDRMHAYKDNFIEKTYLDKVLHKKIAAPSKDETNGLGDLQFFNYPNDMNGAYNELNNELSALDRIEQQIEESGMAHMEMRGLGMDDMGNLGEMNDVGEVGEVGDLGEMGDLSLVDASDFNL